MKMGECECVIDRLFQKQCAEVEEKSFESLERGVNH